MDLGSSHVTMNLLGMNAITNPCEEEEESFKLDKAGPVILVKGHSNVGDVRKATWILLSKQSGLSKTSYSSCIQ